MAEDGLSLDAVSCELNVAKFSTHYLLFRFIISLIVYMLCFSAFFACFRVVLSLLFITHTLSINTNAVTT